MDSDESERINEFEGFEDFEDFDIHNIIPYNFEPRRRVRPAGEGGSTGVSVAPTYPELIEAQSVVEWDGVDVETEGWRRKQFIWCRCGNCRQMPTVRECVCCHDLTECEDRGVPDDIVCIVDDVNFNPCILNQDTLRMTMTNRATIMKKTIDYRWEAYTNFTSWLHGGLGKDVRRVIPSCAVWAIRDRYPDGRDPPQYRGFLEADEF
ncbi:hypothetical protein Bbelb_288550 [Branchiostoma belcheri]|nr:hypothetical protein Bbelb_288550 [Branchiostoma belcheri]